MKTFIGTGVGQPEAAVHQVQFFLWLLMNISKKLPHA